jgi:hypothetical protein
MDGDRAATILVGLLPLLFFFALGPAKQFTSEAQGFFFSLPVSVPSGMERLSASTSLATAEKIGPSSEASAASPASCSRRLMVFSGMAYPRLALLLRKIRSEFRQLRCVTCYMNACFVTPELAKSLFAFARENSPDFESILSRQILKRKTQRAFLFSYLNRGPLLISRSR